jgi:glycosyltransferase involved in cell wall biosynthesis
MELVITDDGSRDETAEVVERFARRVEIPVQFTTHRHRTFQLARCRNEGVAVSRAGYLLFLDGDCLIPPDHVLQHLRRRQPGVVMAGYCCRLDRRTSEQLTVEDVRRRRYETRTTADELKKLARMHRKAQFYSLIRHPSRPKLFGGNMGIYREDYLKVNGYDERFEGWGCEDDDLRLRLRQSGLQIRSILGWTRTYHLWHPRGETTPDEWREGRNVQYLRRGRRAAYCHAGVSRYLHGQAPIEVRPGREATESTLERRSA